MTIEPLPLAQELIRCPSVTPEDGGALTVLQTALEGLGFTCHPVTFSEDGTPDVQNLYARLGDGEPNFCFAGHTDVVPVGDPGAWVIDPFAAEVKDGVLHGRGASDMKSAIACFTSAVSRFLEARDGRFDGSISFLITGDEEAAAINGTKKLLQWVTDRGETLDVCLVGEPTNPAALGDMIKIGRRGSLNGYLTVYGTQGHAAYPHLADNPIHRLVRMIDALIAEAPDQGTDHFQASTVQFSTIDVGNPATNITPGKASAVFNVRFNDLHTAAGIEKWVRERLDPLAKEGDGDYELVIKVSGEAFLTPPGKLSSITSDAVEKVTGRTPELSTSGGTSDARFIKDYCPVAEFGMVGLTMHKANECIATADIEALNDIYLAILEDYFASS